MHGSKKVSVAICLMLNLRLTGLLSITANPHNFLNYYPNNMCDTLLQKA